jgi:hypothetical protein
VTGPYVYLGVFALTVLAGIVWWAVSDTSE